jgi:hypothetical protein
MNTQLDLMDKTRMLSNINLFPPFPLSSDINYSLLLPLDDSDQTDSGFKSLLFSFEFNND